MKEWILYLLKLIYLFVQQICMWCSGTVAGNGDTAPSQADKYLPYPHGVYILIQTENKYVRYLIC